MKTPICAHGQAVGTENEPRPRTADVQPLSKDSTFNLYLWRRSPCWSENEKKHPDPGTDGNPFPHASLSPYFLRAYDRPGAVLHPRMHSRKTSQFPVCAPACAPALRAAEINSLSGVVEGKSDLKKKWNTVKGSAMWGVGSDATWKRGDKFNKNVRVDASHEKVAFQPKRGGGE